jgi:hypothetical protein
MAQYCGFRETRSPSVSAATCESTIPMDSGIGCPRHCSGCGANGTRGAGAASAAPGMGRRRCRSVSGKESQKNLSANVSIICARYQPTAFCRK